MSKIKWKYVSPLKDDTAVEEAELKYCFKLPEDLKQCLEKNNAGVPNLCTFDLNGEKERVFGGLLSFNKDDVDSFYDYVDFFKKESDSSLKMFPFAIDPAGNFFCVYNNKIIMYFHETESIVKISDTFSEFLDMLYK